MVIVGTVTVNLVVPTKDPLSVAEIVLEPIPAPAGMGKLIPGTSPEDVRLATVWTVATESTVTALAAMVPEAVNLVPVTKTLVPRGPDVGTTVSTREVTVNLSLPVEATLSAPRIETVSVTVEAVAAAGIVNWSEPGSSPLPLVNRPVFVVDPKTGLIDVYCWRSRIC